MPHRLAIVDTGAAATSGAVVAASVFPLDLMAQLIPTLAGTLTALWMFLRLIDFARVRAGLPAWFPDLRPKD